MNIFERLNDAKQSVPVDVEGLSFDLGVPVYETVLDDCIAGELVQSKPGQFHININSSNPETRKRFTIAHELGHFLKHRDLIGSGVDDDRAYRSTDIGNYKNPNINSLHETEANQFAAALLMPLDKVKEFISLGLDVPTMAKLLKVSEQAMQIRYDGIYADIEF